MTINKGKLLQTIGWTTVGIGLYLVGLGINYDGEMVNSKRPDDNIIDADFTIIED
jgi:hypothetical protein